MDREWGNAESKSLFISSFSLHFLILSPFSRSPAARLQQVVQPCSWVTNYQPTTHENIPKGSLLGSFFCISTENTLYTVHVWTFWAPPSRADSGCWNSCSRAEEQTRSLRRRDSLAGNIASLIQHLETWSELQVLIFEWCTSFALCEALLLPL